MKSIRSSDIKNPLFFITVGGVILFLVCIGLLVNHFVMGRGLGLRRLMHSAKSLSMAVLDNQNVRAYTRGEFNNIIFLHHSVGYNLIEGGLVREKFSQAGFHFWDHNYNWLGLRGPDGNPRGYSYNVPADNTNPDGLAGILNQKVYSIPLNTFSGLLQHEVIIFKSCFPTSDITSENQLEQYKSWYLGMRTTMSQHPDKLFIIMTQPPLNPEQTHPSTAERARELANWLKSDEYLKDHPNIYTFDFFDYLAEGDLSSNDANMLRVQYREGNDSHPNQLANEMIAPIFVDFVIEAIEHFRSHD